MRWSLKSNSIFATITNVLKKEVHRFQMELSKGEMLVSLDFLNYT